MKKLLFTILLLALLLPIGVKADYCDINKVSIESIDIINKSDNVIEKTPTIVEGKNIKLDLSFASVNDYISYKVVLNNESNDDFEINSDTLNLNSDYFEYKIITDDSKIIKANSKKEVAITIRYKEAVPDSEFTGTSFVENKTLAVSLQNNTEEVPEPTALPKPTAVPKAEEVDVPSTGTTSYIVVFTIFVIVGIITYFLLKNNKPTTLMILIICLFIIPITVNALCKAEIVLDSSIEVEKCRYKLVTDKGSFDSTKEVTSICVDNLVESGEKEFYSLSYNGGVREYIAGGKVYFSIDLNSYSFGDSSFIRIYEDNTKTKLLLELNKNNIPVSMYGIGGLWYKYYDYLEEIKTKISWNIGQVDISKVYVEASSDLIKNDSREASCRFEGNNCDYYQPIEYNLERTNSTMIYKNYKITGPYTDDLNVIDKITTLNTSLNSLDYRFIGFDNCHLNDNLESVCDGNTYYAKYEKLVEAAA